MFIDRNTNIIHVLKTDSFMTKKAGTESYTCDLNGFRLALKAIDGSIEGLPYLRTHNHNTEITIAGITYARILEIINGYRIEFENGSYTVNLVGANSNVGDVLYRNNVSIVTNNSAGLIVSGAGGASNTESELHQWLDSYENKSNWMADISNIPHDVWAYTNRTLTSFGSLIADIWNNATRTLTAGTKDSEIDAIKTKVDTLSNYDDAGVNIKLDAIQADLDNPDQYKADVSAIPTNPLLANDIRLNNLDAKVSSVGGMSESDLHAGLDNYPNKDQYKSTEPDNAKIAQIKNKIDTLTNYDDSAVKAKIDEIKAETDKIQPEIIDKKDEYKAELDATAVANAILDAEVCDDN